MTTPRICQDPACGRFLIQHGNETKQNFEKRVHCNGRCAANHAAGKRIRTKYTGATPAYMVA